MSGWIKLRRSLLDWEWYEDDNAVRLLIHLLVSVNHEDKKWKGMTIKAGSMVTSYEGLADALKKSPKQIRIAMEKLESSGEVARSRAMKGQVVSLVKWAKIQTDEEKRAGNRAPVGQAEGRLRATTKEVREVKEEEEVKNITPNGVVELFHSTCTRMRKVIVFSQKRKTAVRARIREHGVESLEKVFRAAANSDFMNGKNNRGWVADFDWIINPTNYVKILEGKYNNKTQPNATAGKKHHEDHL